MYQNFYSPRTSGALPRRDTTNDKAETYSASFNQLVVLVLNEERMETCFGLKLLLLVLNVGFSE